MCPSSYRACWPDRGDTVRSMIVPDDKDWTWVLARACPECGFDANTCAAEAVPDLVRANARTWRRFLDDGVIRPGRPYPSTWSPLEYACHVRDVYERYSDRIAIMLAEQDPLFANWDQDVSATEGHYDTQIPPLWSHTLAPRPRRWRIGWGASRPPSGRVRADGAMAPHSPSPRSLAT